MMTRDPIPSRRFWLWLQVMLFAAAVQAGPASFVRGNLGIHDPSTIIKCKNKYYIFGTGRGIISKSSPDKIVWNAGPTVFASAPAWTTNAVPAFDGTFWAPDVFYLNGRYCLYYAVSSWGSQVSAIGLVTNPTLDPSDPAYLWTDQGPVIQSVVGSPYNTIDPSVTLDAAGNPWMAFGSYWNGIYLVQLNPSTGLRIAPSSPTYRLAYNSSIEASCLFRRGGYYYLFANWGSCCSGVNSTYNVRLGRSTSITGPYLDRNGVDMANNGGTLFLQGTGKYTGPGHMGILVENGVQSFSYHYYDAGAWAPWYNAFGPADFDLEPLAWTPDNWPVFTNNWSAVYNFQADARDENGQYYGLLLGGASIQTDPVRGRVLNLSGTNQYVQLPPGVAFARTFSAVIKWNGGGDWQRIFDFGVDTSRYVMLTPRAGDGRLRCDIRANGVTQTVSAPGPVPTGVWVHVALTLEGSRGVLYMNGAPVATNGSMTISPVDVLAQTNYLGHSKFSADPDFNGQIACFRASGRVLSAAEIAAPQPVIATPAGGMLYWPGSAIAFSGAATDFTDSPITASGLTWRVEYAQDGVTNVVFGPVSGITNGVFNVPSGATGGGTYRLYLTATDGSSRQATVWTDLLPANPPAGWSSSYAFTADAGDADHHFNGTLNGGASIVSDPARGNVLNLSGNGQYVSLPPGAANLQTFMAWVKWNGGPAWQRIFDFGNDTNRYGVLTPSAANGKLRFSISLNSIAGEQILDAPWPLPVGVWTHVAVTADGSAAILYTNGIPVATNANVNLVPASLGATNNYLGKSQWPDPYFSGQISAARLFSRALTATEITAPQPVISQPVQGAIYHPGDRIGLSGAATDFFAAPILAAGLTWTIQFRYNGATNTVFGPVSGVAATDFTVPSTGPYASNGCYRIVLAATDSLGRQATNFADIFPVSAVDSGGDWASFYPFDSGANDVSNRYSGTLYNGASIQTDAVRGQVLNLSGANQYVGLPGGVTSFQTLAGWVKWNGGAAWQRLFDFGQDTGHFVMLTPLDSGGRMQCAITTDRANYVQTIQAPAALPIGVWTHVAVVFDGRQGILYTNGQVMAINNSVNLFPADTVATKCYLGRSQYTADAYFSGQSDSLRLSSGALSPAALFGPTAVITQPGGIAYAGGDLLAYAGAAFDYSGAPLSAGAFSWSAEFHHDGLTDPAFGPLAGVTNGTFQVPTNGPSTTNAFYRLNLLATDSSGLQSRASADVLPRTATLNLTTVPLGLQVSMDGQVFSAPTSIITVAGMSRGLAAPSPQSLGGSNYSFVLWSDGGAVSHAVSVPLTNAEFTASFIPPTLEVSGSASGLRLTWPAWAPPGSLYWATNLTPPVQWAPVPSVPSLSNGLGVLNLPASNEAAYFRLQAP